MEYCLHCPFLLAMQRPTIIMHVNCSSNYDSKLFSELKLVTDNLLSIYDSNLVHIILDLVSFNILLSIFSSCLHQKYEVQVCLM